MAEADDLIPLKKLVQANVLHMLHAVRAAGAKRPRTVLLDLHRNPTLRVTVLYKRLGFVEGQVSYPQWEAVVDHVVALDKTLPKSKRTAPPREMLEGFAHEFGPSFLIG